MAREFDTITFDEITFMKKLLLLLTLVVALFACRKLIHRDVKCRDFNQSFELKHYAGSIGDTLVFKNGQGDSIRFTISDKYINHRTTYVSDTGCGCYDQWGISYKSESDTLNFWTDEKYVEQNEAKRYYTAAISVHGIISGFITEDVTDIGDFSVGGFSYANARKYEYGHTQATQIKRLILVPGYGVVYMKRVDGMEWIYQKPEEPLQHSISTFSVINHGDCGY